jgi:hypothetical protein
MAESRGEQGIGTQPPNQSVLQIIWGAFVGAVCLYALTAYGMRQLSGRPPASEALSLLVPTLAGVAALLTALIFSWGQVLVKQADYQAYSIIRWALAEAVGIFGLVLAFLGASGTTAVAFFGWALLSLFRLRPTPDDYRRFQRLKGEARK